MKISTLTVCAVFTFVHAAFGQAPPRVPWEKCPCNAQLGTIAAMSVPEGFVFVGRDGIGAFMEATQNPASGDELGVIAAANDTNWFLLFSFQQIGYVKDDEKDNLDADAILESIRKGTEQGNRERRKKGWETLQITGWNRRPFYDPKTNNLTWATMARAESSGDTVNHSVRLLGRSGVMKADVVAAPGELTLAVAESTQLLQGFAFNSGNRYAEFRSGDKVASYGLTALIAGGAGAAVVKSGLLAKLWKAILLGLFAVIAAMRKLWSAVTGRRRSPDIANA
jgi:uncharacterized membrane-anchored protein